MSKAILSVVRRTLTFKADLWEVVGRLAAEYLLLVLRLKLSSPLWLSCRALGFPLEGKSRVPPAEVTTVAVSGSTGEQTTPL